MLASWKLNSNPVSTHTILHEISMSYSTWIVIIVLVYKAITKLNIRKELKCYFSGKPSFSELVHRFHTALTTHYTKGGHHLYDPNEMEEFCKIHAPGLFDEVYGSILNDTRQSPQQLVSRAQKTGHDQCEAKLWKPDCITCIAGMFLCGHHQMRLESWHML